MKKIILSLSVVIIFVLYSMVLRHKVDVAIPRPTSLSQSSTSAGSSNSTSQSSGSSPGATTTQTSYKDGTYTGSIADAYYGNVQVKAAVSGGKITSVVFLQYPNTHSTSVYINQQAMPYLQQEAIQNQTANVNTITGATFTSQAFVQSLNSALSQAQ